MGIGVEENIALERAVGACRYRKARGYIEALPGNRLKAYQAVSFAF